MIDESTVAACLTPPGVGAIAVLAVRGPDAWTAARQLFRPASKQPLPEQPPAVGSVWVGHFGADVADEAVLSLKESSRHPWLEVHCHGGRAVVDLLLTELEQTGVRICSWPEFLRLVEPPLRAAALERLAHARTARAAAILLDQANGALKKGFDSIRNCLPGHPAAAKREIDEVLKFADLGRHLVEPWRVVVAGAPNVGKSSLVNALAGYQRSVVAPLPGTTRDVVTTELAIDGWPVELHDTAGLRPDAGDLESEGIALAREVLAGADLTLWLLDATAEPVWPDQSIDPRRLLVVNKTDRPLVWNAALAEGGVFVSAQTGAGISGLCAAISRRLVPVSPSPGCPVPFLASQVAALEAARGEIAAGRPDGALELLHPG